MVHVLDACALLTYLNDEHGSDIVDDLLKKAADGKIDVYISIVNLIEVHYANIRVFGPAKAAAILENILDTPIRVVSSVSDAVFQQSSRLKAFYKCSIADAIGLATAIDLSGQFVSSDHHELRAVIENEPIPFLWLPPHPKKSTTSP